MSIDPTASRLAGEGVAYAPQIASAARRHGLDPDLLAAVAAQETGGPGTNAGRNVVGDGGHGHGLFQIDDRWHAFARTPEVMDPASNAYNAGSPNATGTRTDWPNGERLGYADSVMRHYSEIGGGAAETVPAQ